MEQRWIGWDDLTFGNSSGTIRTFVNTGGNGYIMLALPITQKSGTGETKDILVFLAEFGCIEECSIYINKDG